MNRDAGTQTQTTTVTPPFSLAPQIENYATQSLGGDFFGGNQYTDDLVDRSGRSIINQVQSNFGRAGRSARGMDAAGVAADRLVDLNAVLRGPLYEAERARQQQTFNNLIGPTTTQSIPLQSNLAGNVLGGATLGRILLPNNNWGGLIGGLGGLFG